MLYIETWRDRHSKNRRPLTKKSSKLTFKTLPWKIILPIAVLYVIFFFWFDCAYPAFGSKSLFNNYFSKKKNDDSYGIYIEPGLTLADGFSVAEFLKSYPKFKVTEKDSADIVIDNEKLASLQDGVVSDASSEVVIRKVLVPITKFGNLKRSITEDEFHKIEYYEKSIINNNFFDPSLDSNLKLQAPGECADLKTFVNENDSLALIPIDCLDSSVSILAIDNYSIFGQIIDNNRTSKLDENTLLSNYKAKYEVWMNYGNDDYTKEAVAYIRNFFTNSVDSLAKTNSIVMTGVTAMGRGTMWKIRDYGSTYPIEKVADVLKDADIAHTSNEVSFVPGCTQESHTMSFCALPESIDTLTYGGVDVVELTGNHNNDKGWSYNADSMDKYTEKGITYVGGGKNSEEAYKVKYTNLGDYKIAWFGFNELGPAYAWATDDTPGAAEYYEDKLVAEAKEAAANSDIAIMVFQWANENYSYPTDFQKKTARLAIDNGVDLVVGSQGHGTLKMEFYNGVPIYYGLGNFLFDQMFSDKVRSGMILRINTIEGEIVNLEMLPYMIENYSQPNFVYGDVAKSIVDEVVEW